ncbi:MAG: hypothetical protein COB36_07400 [Alphaproteobacteria bacterium]|nr:MAG: hypothetical protein COB36_07400 [Alphaproteobacteria bacterium]
MAKVNRKPLKGQEAIDLWLKGKDAWNHEVMLRQNFDVDFSGVDFSEYRTTHPIISFVGFHFPNGNVSFIGAQFGDGGVSFVGAQFGAGDVFFSCAEFGNGKVTFSNVKFGGSAFFTDLGNIKNIKSFSFESSVFDGPFNISSDETFPCIIDLTHTKTAHHMSLDGLKCVLRCEGELKSYFDFDRDWVKKKTVADKGDIARARRLKELAEANKDHQAAQDFHVLEMQAKRVHSKCPIGYLWNTEFWYEKLSDYGRSISRPLDRLWDICLFYMAAYIGISYQIVGHFNCLKSLIYSAAQMFAFIPSSRNARSDIRTVLFDEPPPDLIYALTFSQSILALMLLFLLGLGLRHRYRI